MKSSELEKEILLMKVEVYQRVREIKIKRILSDLKKFKVIKSIKMVGNLFVTKKIN